MSNFRLSSIGVKTIFVAECVFGWCVLLLPAFLVILPFWLWKICAIFLARIIHPSFRPVPGSESMFVVDRIFKKADQERSALANGLTCLELDISSDEIDLKQFAQKLEDAVFQNKDLKNYIWKLKSYLVQFCGHTFWVEAPNFCILNHVSKVELPPEQNLMEYLNDWKATPFESAKSPPWEVRILKHKSKEQIVFKFHHSVVDGISIFDILGMLFQENTPQTPRMLSDLNGTNFLYKVSRIFKIPFLLFKTSRLMRVQDALEFDSGPEMAQMTSSQILNLTELKEIAKKYEVRFQTVLLTICAGIIRRFIAKTGRAIPDYTVLCIPRLRPNRPSHFIGNHWNPAICVPVGMTHRDPKKRLAQVETELDQIYSTDMDFANEILTSFVSILPYKLCKYLVKRASTPVRCTISPLRLPGLLVYETRAVTGIRLHMGLTNAQTGAISMLLSYQDELTWTITGAKNLFQTQEQLDLLTGQFLAQEIAQLTAADASNFERKPGHCEITIE